MREIIILRCSPHANGVTDQLAAYFMQGLAGKRINIRSIALRDYRFSSCNGCGHCSHPPFKCVYHDEDELASLFTLLQNARMVVMSVPIYFYGIPALCAAFIDRAQYLWQSNNMDYGRINSPFAPGILLLAAGRKRGINLFTGARLSISHFFSSSGSRLLARYAFRGLDGINELASHSEIPLFLCRKAKNWAQYLELNSQ